MKKLLNSNFKYFLVIIIIFITIFFLLVQKKKNENTDEIPPLPQSEIIIEPIEIPFEPEVYFLEEERQKLLPNITTEKPPLQEIIIHDVPFTSQAPLANWDDKRQQDGCEEASVLMAVKWGRQENLNTQEALQEILAASDYILEKYGEYRDTDLEAVLNWLIKDYFQYEKAEIKKNVTINDLIAELKNNRIIIMPANGQVLKNPNFTAPGPLNHMLLIRGYNPIKKVFITNDPGTRKGNLYEYDENILYNALRTYPTGYKEENLSPRKDVIIFWR